MVSFYVRSAERHWCLSLFSPLKKSFESLLQEQIMKNTPAYRPNMMAQPRRVFTCIIKWHFYLKSKWRKTQSWFSQQIFHCVQAPLLPLLKYSILLQFSAKKKKNVSRAFVRTEIPIHYVWDSKWMNRSHILQSQLLSVVWLQIFSPGRI